MNPREYYIYNIPVFVHGEQQPGVDIPEFCSTIQEMLPRNIMKNVDVCYIMEDPILDGRAATYADGAIYMDINEPTNDDLIENFVHEVAHAAEVSYPHFIYDNRLIAEFKGKRRKLYHLLKAEGYDQMPLRMYEFSEYTRKFDDFLATTVGYPTLLTLTMGLFCSPYGATSVQEYFANGFEKYFTESPEYVRNVSPVVYRKIIEILDDND
tara:strand:+ start:669 stop:1298 length:630 start_codon:yes stop_codon:yes gene_type:complete